MLGELNKIRNSDFTEGADKPRAWTWVPGSGTHWRPAPATNGKTQPGIHLHSARDDASGMWVQTFRAKSDQHYRIEAVVSCDCRPARPDGGLVLALQPFDTQGRPGKAVAMPAVRNVRQRTLRAYYRTPQAMRRIELRIGLVRARGTAAVHDVRVVPVLEPEAKSHPWAIPAPPFAQPAPVKVERICVMTGEPDRPLVRILRARFGVGAVSVCSSRTFAGTVHEADAVFLLDAGPPAACRTIEALKVLAKNRIVIVALPCIERISDEHLATRMVRQIDDPLHARVRYADFITNGFALHDIIPFAGRGDDSTEMCQRQFRTNRVFREYCRKHGFEMLLESETDADATSEKPVALLHRTPGGAILVMDVEPAEAVDSTLGEPVVAVHLLMSALGASRTALGQYTAPARDMTEFNRHVQDMIERFPALAYAEGAKPRDADAPYLVTLGRDVASFGLPVAPRPLLLVRTGLRSDDLLGPYAAMYWLKQLVRPAPFDSPYARSVAAKYRVAWMPRCAPPAKWGGWRADASGAPWPVEAEFEPDTVAACIDLTAGAHESVTIVTHRRDEFHRLVAGALPALARQLVAARHLRRAEAAHLPADAMARAAWCSDDLPVRVLVDPARFGEPMHRAATRAGARLIRVEIPGVHTAPFADSIWQSEWATQMLEQIVGLLLGLIVVNRDAEPLPFDWPIPLADLRSRAVLRRVNEPEVDLPLPKGRNGRLTVPPAHAIVAVR